MAETSLIPKRPLSLKPAALCQQLSLVLRSREWMQAHREEGIWSVVRRDRPAKSRW